jgi:hypothetical protein
MERQFTLLRVDLYNIISYLDTLVNRFTFSTLRKNEPLFVALIWGYYLLLKL